MSGLYSLFKTLAFQKDPEWVHEKTLKYCSKFPSLAYFWAEEGDEDERGKLSLSLGKLNFPFPVGLAAGLDKNAECIPFFKKLLFGSVEVGTVTPLPQEGNQRPRLFRYIPEEALRNKMGFNNQGAAAVLENIRRSRVVMQNRKILGINLGKNKITPQEKAIDDYVFLYRKFAPVGDYLVINISSPNTPGLRDLQEPGFLKELLSTLQEDRDKVPVPLFLKLSPDLDFQAIKDISEVAYDFRLAGIIGTNTTSDAQWGEGGVSGRPLQERARIIRHYLLEKTKDWPDFHIIGVGGISCFEDLWDFWRMGGKVVQIYTAFIFQGPSLLRSIKRRIIRSLDYYHFPTLQGMLAEMDQLKGPPPEF